MRRRDVLTILGTLPAIVSIPSARAQFDRPDLVPLDPEAIAELANSWMNVDVRSRVFTDVRFVTSWRAQLMPLEYEDENFISQAADNRERVFSALLDTEELSSLADRNAEQAAEWSQEFVDRFAENIDKFASFMELIGINVWAPAFNRIVDSLYAYAVMNSVVLSSPEVEEASNSSYFWPFC